ncbi:MAG: chitobiase/beta-hexosaminidase C-terminal domain-containing protein [Balneolales bacterium]
MNSKMLCNVLIFLTGFGFSGALLPNSNARGISILPHFKSFSDVDLSEDPVAHSGADDPGDYHSINIVHNGNFEHWVDDKPLGWLGDRSSIPASHVAPYSAAIHSGDLATQLTNTSSSHVRFTTQPLSIEAHTEYTVSFQARGSGNIRNAFFRDGNYSSYSDYTRLDTGQWQLMEYTFSHNASVDDVQVIFSVQSTTDAHDHIQIDNVSITFESDNLIVMPPVFFPAGDVFSAGSDITVYMSSTDPNATIYFTDDNTEPTETSQKYFEPVVLSSTTILKAIARTDTVNSAMAEEMYTFEGSVEVDHIADVRAMSTGQMVILKGIVTSTDFGFDAANYFVQDETGGIYINNVTEGGATNGPVVAPGDSVRLKGFLDIVHNQITLEINYNEGGFQQVLSNGNGIPKPVAINVDDWNADSEYQGMRVQLHNVRLTEESEWPSGAITNENGANVQVIRSDSDTFNVHLARNNTPWGNGSMAPPAIFNVSGTMGQYNDDTQLIPFFEDDFQSAAKIQFANLIGSPTNETHESEPFMVYAQVRADGFTDTDVASDSIQAWIGYHTENVSPSESGWTWINAGFNSGFEDEGHEYMADIGSGLSPGVYYYVSRFQLMEFDYVYGGISDGFWDGENNVSGQLTVVKPTSIYHADPPKEFDIDQNYPNPFNPWTQIRYAVPEPAHVTIQVYNVTGQLVATPVNEFREAGYHDVTFDGTRLASGIYIYRMHAAGFVKTHKWMLIK